MNSSKFIRVVAGVAIEGGRVLVARRPAEASFGGLWEFPGGKVEPGEGDEEALIRELAEELGVRVVVGKQLGVHRHRYGDLAVELHFYRIHLNGEEPHGLEGAELRWITPEESVDLSFLEGDADLLLELQSPETLERWST